ncbi:MAG: protein translocase subunit SecD [Pseudomonadota bacterium]
MQNRFPLWKNTLILVVFVLSVIYALPNLYGEDPSVQVSPSRTSAVDDALVARIEKSFSSAGFDPLAIEVNEKHVLARFSDTETQLKAADLLRTEIGNDYTVALNLAPATPAWLRAVNAQPMYLGLDLRGGVHFLLQVDMDAALAQAEERYTGDIRSALRNEKIRYTSVSREAGRVKVKFSDGVTLEKARDVIGGEFRNLELSDTEANELIAIIPETEIREIRKFALAQNMTTLRNRVDELGVAEPVIQQQGEDRIVVQLPGVQDTARAKEILGATATLEFRMADTDHDVRNAVEGRIPIGSRLYYERDGSPILLKRQIIVTGDQIVDASSGLEQDSMSAAVFITLNGVGAKKMAKTTRENIGKPMAVVFIENKTETVKENGKTIIKKRKVAEVINVATIRDTFSKRFQITGLSNTQEARNLALLLRAGALAAPVDIIEERTVGPSLGKDNIEQGFISALGGLLLVVVFMGFYYKVFGLVANIALAFNLVLLIAILSLLQATLTLPGIGGIVLTIGMAVDANVLIFERIREEIRNRNTPQSSIFTGYERAFATIFDANITTLITALVLFGFGSGPVKGFAVTLSIGILTSMFTAVTGTRMIVNLLYGNRRVQKLPI